MSLVVEDGTGLANADSYLSVADATSYHASFGNDAWAAATSDAQEQALRRATQYVDANYSFRGSPLTTTQALAWPRNLGLAWPIRGLSNATAELALRALDGALFADQSGGEVIEESVGPVGVKYQPSGLGGQTRFAVVDSLLAPYTGGGRMSMRLERAE